MAKQKKIVPNRLSRRTERATGVAALVPHDQQFSRVFADQAVVMILGHDVELGYIAVSPKIETWTSRNIEGAAFRMTPTFTEVVRVRMPPASAAASAVTLIEQMIAKGMINKTELLKTIDEFQEPEADEADEADEVNGPDDVVDSL